MIIKIEVHFHRLYAQEASRSKTDFKVVLLSKCLTVIAIARLQKNPKNFAQHLLTPTL